MSEGREKLDTFVAQQPLAFEEPKDLVSEQFFRSDRIDVRQRQPRTIPIPKPASRKGMQVWVWLDQAPKGLRNRDDTGASVVITHSFSHQLLDRLEGKSGDISEKLPSVHKVGPKHLWDREYPQAVADIFEQFVFEKGGESGGPVRVT